MAMTQAQVDALNDAKQLGEFCYIIANAKPDIRRNLKTDRGMRMIDEICYDAECRGERNSNLYPFIDLLC